MAELGNLSCCGIYELVGISNLAPERAVQDLLKDIGYNGPLPSDADTPLRYVIFSQAGNGKVFGPHNGYGSDLVSYIKKYKLGTLATLPAGINPNSGNILKVWLWKLDHKVLYKYGLKKGLVEPLVDDDDDDYIDYHRTW